MQQLEFFDIASPCIGVCQSGNTGYCLGCFRSRDERLHWINLDLEVKSKIVRACGVRKKRAMLTKKEKSPSKSKPIQGSLLNNEHDCP
ncbi:MAG: putative Fe-S protein YdhL (DUF1289 family) [Paraglaciecola sp.]|jgi:predicted Fe-S protein YdhL (DUF1289 family)